MDTNATSFTSPLSDAKYGTVNVPSQLGYVVDTIAQTGVWTVLFTILAVLVAYDQSMLLPVARDLADRC